MWTPASTTADSSDRRSFGSVGSRAFYLLPTPATDSWATSSASSCSNSTSSRSRRQRANSPLPVPGIVFGRLNYAKVLRPGATSQHRRVPARRPTTRRAEAGSGDASAATVGSGCPFKDKKPSCVAVESSPPSPKPLPPPQAEKQQEIVASIVNLETPLTTFDAATAPSMALQRTRALVRRAPRLPVSRQTTPPEERQHWESEADGNFDDDWTASGNTGASSGSGGSGGGSGRFRILRSFFRRVRRRSRSAKADARRRRGRSLPPPQPSRPPMLQQHDRGTRPPSLSPSPPPTPPPPSPDDSDDCAESEHVVVEQLVCTESAVSEISEVVVATFPGQARHRNQQQQQEQPANQLAFLASLLDAQDAASFASSTTAATKPRTPTPPPSTTLTTRQKNPKQSMPLLQQKQSLQQQKQPMRQKLQPSSTETSTVSSTDSKNLQRRTLPPKILPPTPQRPTAKTKTVVARRQMSRPSPPPPPLPSKAELRRRQRDVKLRRMEQAVRNLFTDCLDEPQAPPLSQPPLLKSTESPKNNDDSATGEQEDSNDEQLEEVEHKQLLESVLLNSDCDGDSIVSFTAFNAGPSRSPPPPPPKPSPPLPPPATVVTQPSHFPLKQLTAVYPSVEEASVDKESQISCCSECTSSDLRSSGSNRSGRSTTHSLSSRSSKSTRSSGGVRLRSHDQKKKEYKQRTKKSKRKRPIKRKPKSGSDDTSGSGDSESCSEAKPIHLTFSWRMSADDAQTNDTTGSGVREDTADDNNTNWDDSTTKEDAVEEESPPPPPPPPLVAPDVSTQAEAPPTTVPSPSNSAAQAAAELLARLSGLRRHAPAGMESALRRELESLARTVGCPLTSLPPPLDGTEGGTTETGAESATSATMNETTASFEDEEDDVLHFNHFNACRVDWGRRGFLGR